MSLKREYIIGTTLGRLVLPMYIWACPNILAIEPSSEFDPFLSNYTGFSFCLSRSRMGHRSTALFMSSSLDPFAPGHASYPNLLHSSAASRPIRTHQRESVGLLPALASSRYRVGRDRLRGLRHLYGAHCLCWEGRARGRIDGIGEMGLHGTRPITFSRATCLVKLPLMSKDQRSRLVITLPTRPVCLSGSPSNLFVLRATPSLSPTCPLARSLARPFYLTDIDHHC